MTARSFFAAACLLSLAACGDSPTSPQTPARHNAGGWTAGSGNRADSTTTTSSTSGTAVMACEPDGRGGWTAGSGNVVCAAP